MKLQKKKMSITNRIKKDDELKGDNTKSENEGIIQYGNDFKNCKTFHDRDSP